MQMLSEHDLNLRDLSAEELDAAWELWFQLMQHTNAADPPYTHGVFAYMTAEDLGIAGPETGAGSPRPSERLLLALLSRSRRLFHRAASVSCGRHT